MLAHGQTTTWDIRVDMKARPGNSDRLGRLRSWLSDHTRRQRPPIFPLTYAYWDNARERFYQPILQGALDHAAAQLGPSWAITFYGSLM